MATVRTQNKVSLFMGIELNQALKLASSSDYWKGYTNCILAFVAYETDEKKKCFVQRVVREYGQPPYTLDSIGFFAAGMKLRMEFYDF